MAKSIEVYTMKTCPYCIRAKELLKSRGIEFREILVPMDDDKMWDALAQKSNGMQTVPQIYCDGQIVGGYSDLADLDQKDKLQSLK
ncbi:glutaredoxin 3 [Candidatus Adlerbacteria bacterium RIFOXYB1_FULL_48_10]|nr:MAG: glutaredoxin 3 [Candidatus Adlerbacteria bacterium RIFOXYB1_FULL_48_10]